MATNAGTRRKGWPVSDEMDDTRSKLRWGPFAVTSDDSQRYASIAYASVAGTKSARTETATLATEELWRRLCRRAGTEGPLADADARVLCQQELGWAIREANREQAKDRRAPDSELLRRLVEDEAAAEEPDATDPRREWVLQHLGLLTPRRRQVVELMLGGAETNEVASALGLKPGSVRKLMERANRTLSRRRDREMRNHD
jgi:DNA-directed RNA polymerase specialized sigma24 family protein